LLSLFASFDSHCCQGALYHLDVDELNVSALFGAAMGKLSAFSASDILSSLNPLVLPFCYSGGIAEFNNTLPMKPYMPMVKSSSLLLRIFQTLKQASSSGSISSQAHGASQGSCSLS
jgi:hypothetical protein